MSGFTLESPRAPITLPLTGRPVVPITQRLRVLRRELNLRCRKYPQWVAEGRMTRDQAVEQIVGIAAIIDDYERLPDDFWPKLLPDGLHL